MSRNEGKAYKREAIKVAEDLMYGSEVIEKIKAAKDSDEVSRIMATARQKSSAY